MEVFPSKGTYVCVWFWGYSLSLLVVSNNSQKVNSIPQRIQKKPLVDLIQLIIRMMYFYHKRKHTQTSWSINRCLFMMLMSESGLVFKSRYIRVMGNSHVTCKILITQHRPHAADIPWQSTCWSLQDRDVNSGSHPNIQIFTSVFNKYFVIDIMFCTLTFLCKYTESGCHKHYSSNRTSVMFTRFLKHNLLKGHIFHNVESPNVAFSEQQHRWTRFKIEGYYSE